MGQFSYVSSFGMRRAQLESMNSPSLYEAGYAFTSLWLHTGTAAWLMGVSHKTDLDVKRCKTDLALHYARLPPSMADPRLPHGSVRYSTYYFARCTQKCI